MHYEAAIELSVGLGYLALCNTKWNVESAFHRLFSFTIPPDHPQSKKVVFYGQEPPSGKSTTTECGVNYQLLAEMY